MPPRMRQVAEAAGLPAFQIGAAGDIQSFLHSNLAELITSPTPGLDQVLAAHLPYYPAEVAKVAAHGRARGVAGLERFYAAQDLSTRLGNVYNASRQGSDARGGGGRCEYVAPGL